ncbi:FAD-binding oxidoreductase [Legionella birminghamensis]|nr:FAD-binding oxidoreductase [Legionella birminghamensis]
MPFGNFAHNLQTESKCFRPDTEKQIEDLQLSAKDSILARGAGTSYNDCCLNDQHSILDTTRLNHFLSFDSVTGLLVCQGGVTFADLFSIDPNFIPPVIPGTLRATLAGGIANDVHGKNNPREAALGQHIEWLELQCQQESVHCSPKENADLFYATIGGLGLTGIIKRVGLKLKKAPQFVKSQNEKFQQWDSLIQRMLELANSADYQAAWLDLLNPERSVLSYAHYEQHVDKETYRSHKLPPIPFRLINRVGMKLFNQFYYYRSSSQSQLLPLPVFNNPLDKISNWSGLYGKKGLIQFQAVIDKALIKECLTQCLLISRKYQALPSLAVLKYLSQNGRGLLSFTQPGFTIAIDYVNQPQARQAVMDLNDWVTRHEGKVYLAKDILLTAEQFKIQYPNHDKFIKLLATLPHHPCSDLARRLGICI